MGRLDESLAEIKKAQELDPISPVINQNVGFTLMLMQSFDKAINQYQEILDELLAYLKQGYLFSCDIAYLYLNLGDKEKTFEWLEKAYDDRESLFTSMALSWWDSIQSDPRYIALLRKMRLE